MTEVGRGGRGEMGSRLLQEGEVSKLEGSSRGLDRAGASEAMTEARAGTPCFHGGTFLDWCSHCPGMRGARKLSGS